MIHLKAILGLVITPFYIWVLIGFILNNYAVTTWDLSYRALLVVLVLVAQYVDFIVWSTELENAHAERRTQSIKKAFGL